MQRRQQQVRVSRPCSPWAANGYKAPILLLSKTFGTTQSISQQIG